MTLSSAQTLPPPRMLHHSYCGLVTDLCSSSNFHRILLVGFYFHVVRIAFDYNVA